jgi:uncharacterized repeat protein (TIGR02543 family)
MMHTVNFNAGPGGSLRGDTSQTVANSGSTTAVEAVPDTGYRFTGWIDTAGNTYNANPLTLTNVITNTSVRANFAIRQYTVTFNAGPNGSIRGDTSQTVNYGGTCTAVTAVPAAGYEFAGWSGGYSITANPLTVSNVTSNMAITANFREKETVTHTVNFNSNTGGNLSGETYQTVTDGGNTTLLTANPAEGYEFDGWSGDYSGMENPVVLTNVTNDMTVTANFKPKTYTVNTSTDTGGNVSGSPTEPVIHGNTVTLNAVPEEGYEFTGWTGDYTGTENPLILTNVTSNLNIIANFRIKTYTVQFVAGAGGSITGTATQTVAHGGSCTAVSAAPDAGYEFAGWSGAHTGMENPLTISPVTSNMIISAGFEETVENLPPQKPKLENPKNNAVIPPGPAELQTGGYSDPEGDDHSKTWWQVSRTDDPELFINDKSDSDLTSYPVSTGFEPGLKYVWRTAFQDAGSGKYSPWSDVDTFLVGITEVDENIPPVKPGVTARDFRMVSFIQWPEDPSASAVFGPMMPRGYNMVEYRIGIYDPTYGQGGYREYPNFTVEPGRAYWFLARLGLDLTVEGVPVSTSVDICVRLKFNTSNNNGWNMIATPNADYNWGDLHVMEKDASGNILFGPVPISQLTGDNEYIDTRIWQWMDGSYSSTSSPGFSLKKYNGYWVRAKKANVYLCFPAEAQLAQAGPVMMIAAWAKEISKRFTDTFEAIGAAYADISQENPPMPMEDFDGKTSGGGSGCFVSSIAEREFNP